MGLWNLLLHPNDNGFCRPPGPDLSIVRPTGIEPFNGSNGSPLT